MGVLLIGCNAEPVREVDAVQIEAVLQEYYEAFSCYDLDRLEAVFTEETWKEEEWEIRALVLWAEDRKFKSEHVSIISIESDRGSTLVIVEVKSNLALGEDHHYLMREHSSWKITGPLTKKVGRFSPVETPPDPFCCP